MNPTTVQLIGATLFALAVVHTFSVSYFERLAQRYPTHAGAFHFLGEVEVVFGFWALVFVASKFAITGKTATVDYIEGRNFTEPLFVFVVMVIAASKPIIELASLVVRGLTRAAPVHSRSKPMVFYFIVLGVVPLLGSFITEPAAMTLAALLLREHFFSKNISTRLKYATLGVLFVNISIGGTLTAYAAPPVLMVAQTWKWDSAFMIENFGWRAALAVCANALAITLIFAKQLRHIPYQATGNKHTDVPWPIIIVSLCFLAIVVVFAHYESVFIGIFLFFLGFASAYEKYQAKLMLREALLVGFFLAGLVVLGAQQQWWLQPILSGLSPNAAFWGAAALTAITDNAALTYLASLVPGLSDEFKYMVVAGAVTGGGLTVIANAPNPGLRDPERRIAGAIDWRRRLAVRDFTANASRRNLPLATPLNPSSCRHSRPVQSRRAGGYSDGRESRQALVSAYQRAMLKSPSGSPPSARMTAKFRGVDKPHALKQVRQWPELCNRSARMIPRYDANVLPSEITTETQYKDRFDRRKFLRRSAAGVGVTALALQWPVGFAAAASPSDALFKNVMKSPFSTAETITPIEHATTKTRFRELEDDIAKNAEKFETRPWKVEVVGECLKPRTFDIDDLLTLAPMEERIYRMLCTEGWSQVVPYIGYPFAEIMKRVQPTGNAKFVEFTSAHNPAQLRGQREITYISWPYVEGLRMDEAMHPLTLVALGAYGQALPKGLGAPLAIRAPWKFGAKSPKAVVRIRLMETQPLNVWKKHYPRYHSFWGNINPGVKPGLFTSGPTERRYGDLLKRPTLPFNGYAEHVASMYAGMNPKDMF